MKLLGELKDFTNQTFQSNTANAHATVKKNNLFLLHLLLKKFFYTNWLFMDLDHILYPFSFTRCGSTHALRSSLTLILHLKTYRHQQEWKWCLRPWSGVYTVSLVWKCVSTLTILHKYKCTFLVSIAEEWWMRKEISLWPTSYLMKKRFASARETVTRGWIICLKNCNYIKKIWIFFLLHLRITLLLNCFARFRFYTRK